METLKDLLDKLKNESKERMQDELNDLEAISYEVGVQSTIKEIKKWIKKNDCQRIKRKAGKASCAR